MATRYIFQPDWLVSGNIMDLQMQNNTAVTIYNAQKCTFCDVNCPNFLEGDTSEPPYGRAVKGDPLPNPHPDDLWRFTPLVVRRPLHGPRPLRGRLFGPSCKIHLPTAISRSATARRRTPSHCCCYLGILSDRPVMISGVHCKGETRIRMALDGLDWLCEICYNYYIFVLSLFVKSTPVGVKQ